MNDHHRTFIALQPQARAAVSIMSTLNQFYYVLSIDCTVLISNKKIGSKFLSQKSLCFLLSFTNFTAILTELLIMKLYSGRADFANHKSCGRKRNFVTQHTHSYANRVLPLLQSLLRPDMRFYVLLTIHATVYWIHGSRAYDSNQRTPNTYGTSWKVGLHGWTKRCY